MQTLLSDPDLGTLVYLNESHAQYIAIKLQPPTMNERYGLSYMQKAVEQAVQSAMLMCSYAFVCFMNHMFIHMLGTRLSTACISLVPRPPLFFFVLHFTNTQKHNYQW